MDISNESYIDNRDVVIRLDRVSKEYILGLVSGRTLRDAIKEKIQHSSENTSKYNQKFLALKDVSLDIYRGETVGIIGANGAGKSTLLKLISRITAPTRGTIYLKGRVASILEVGTGFHQELTGRENIYLNGSILGMTKTEIDSKMDSIIKFSECEKFIDTPVKRYSSGMYVKLAFAVASHLESEILIMDEVLAVGDLKFQKKCLAKMKEVANEEHKTILYVSHNMETIAHLCSRCIVLDHGEIIFDGDVSEATKIYRGDNLRTENTMDLSQYLRPSWLWRDDVRLIWAEYTDKADKRNIPDTLTLCWIANRDVVRAGIRIELMDGTDKPFATQVIYDLFTGKAGERGIVHIKLQLDGLMNGSYQTYYTVFGVNIYRQSEDYDCVRGLDIVIQRNESDDLLHWENDAWGNIKLGDNGGRYEGSD